MSGTKFPKRKRNTSRKKIIDSFFKVAETKETQSSDKRNNIDIIRRIFCSGTLLGAGKIASPFIFTNMLTGCAPADESSGPDTTDSNTIEPTDTNTIEPIPSLSVSDITGSDFIYDGFTPFYNLSITGTAEFDSDNPIVATFGLYDSDGNEVFSENGFSIEIKEANGSYSLSIPNGYVTKLGIYSLQASFNGVDILGNEYNVMVSKSIEVILDLNTIDTQPVINIDPFILVGDINAGTLTFSSHFDVTGLPIESIVSIKYLITKEGEKKNYDNLKVSQSDGSISLDSSDIPENGIYIYDIYVKYVGDYTNYEKLGAQSAYIDITIKKPVLLEGGNDIHTLEGVSTTQTLVYDEEIKSATIESSVDDLNIQSIVINGNTLTYIYAGPVGFEEELTINATNSNGNTLRTFINVFVDTQYSNESPVNVSQIPNASVDENTPYSLDITSYFSDPEGDVLTYRITGAPDGFSVDTNGAITGTTPEVSSDTDYSIMVYASDLDSEIGQLYVLTVRVVDIPVASWNTIVLDDDNFNDTEAHTIINSISSLVNNLTNGSTFRLNNVSGPRTQFISIVGDQLIYDGTDTGENIGSNVMSLTIINSDLSEITSPDFTVTILNN